MNVRKGRVVSCAILAWAMATVASGERGRRGAIETEAAGVAVPAGVVVVKTDSTIPMSSRAVECADGEVYDDGTSEAFAAFPVTTTFGALAMQFTPPEYPWTYDQVCIALSRGGTDQDFTFDIRIWDDNGVGGGPGDELSRATVTAYSVPSAPVSAFYDFDILASSIQVTEGSVYIGLAWQPDLEQELQMHADLSTGTPFQPMYVTDSNVGVWLPTQTTPPLLDFRAFLLRAEGQGDCNGNGVPDELELYVVEDIDDPGGPTGDFEDISGTGTPLTLGHDQVFGPVSIGFPFVYFGVPATEVWISSNGFIRVNEDGDSGPVPAAIPTAGGLGGDGIIAGWWADLNPSLGGSVHYQTIGFAPFRRFIVQYTDIELAGGGAASTFQIKLFEDTGDIVIELFLAGTGGVDHTIGIETVTGEFGFSYPTAASGFSNYPVRFRPTGGTDCNGNGVLDDCEEDCNANGLTDECDIEFGTSNDCDKNGIPDECDIDDGTWADCQPNGVPDWCELKALTCIEQPSLETTAVFSDLDCDGCGGGAQVLAEQIQVIDPISFQAVRFRGGYFPSGNPPAEDAFTVALFNDSAGLPLNPPATFSGPTPAMSRVLTGAQINGVDEYEYVIEYPFPISVIGPNPIWLEIYNDTSGSTDTWMWSRGTMDPILGTPGIAYSFAAPPGEVWVGDSGTDLSLELICANLPDCNGNGVPDQCDIDDGTSDDCNNDGVPNECELIGGTGDDCNLNGVPDACEVEPDFTPSGTTLPALLCVNAGNICPGFTYAGTTGALGPGTSQSLFCGVFFGVNDVWYRYRPRWTGQAFVSVQGPPIDWLISIHSWCPGTTANQVACSDLEIGLGFDVEAGEEYLIRLAGSGFTYGPYELTLLGPDCLPSTTDTDGNGVPDECDCLADVTGDGVVDNADYLAVLMAQGACAGCPEDIDGSGVVDAIDLQIVLTSQGPCPF